MFIEIDEYAVVFAADARSERSQGGGKQLGVAFVRKNLEGEFTQPHFVAAERADAVESTADFG